MFTAERMALFTLDFGGGATHENPPSTMWLTVLLEFPVWPRSPMTAKENGVFLSPGPVVVNDRVLEKPPSGEPQT